jgi:hypothetical protein
MVPSSDLDQHLQPAENTWDTPEKVTTAPHHTILQIDDVEASIGNGEEKPAFSSFPYS